MTKINQKTKSLFSQSYILGGSPCSGKSTIAEKLSAQFHLHYYKVDDHEREHMGRSRPDRHPVMFKLSKMSWNDIWSRPVECQVKEELSFYRERFEMIVEDLLECDPQERMILEGAAYLPELLANVGVDSQRVLFMVPTKAFQLHHYAQRPWIHQILKECQNPEQAFANWMARDHVFGQEILRQAKLYGFRTLLVDGNRNIDAQFDFVIRCFDLKGGYDYEKGTSGSDD